MPSPCERLHWLSLYPFVTTTIDDTKTLENMPLPSQCERALKVRSHCKGDGNGKFFRQEWVRLDLMKVFTWRSVAMT